MSLRLSLVAFLVVAAYLAGVWSAFNVGRVVRGAEAVRVWAVRRISGEPACPRGDVCDPIPVTSEQ